MIYIIFDFIIVDFLKTKWLIYTQGELMKSKVHEENEASKLDLNVLLKRVKDQENSEKKFNIAVSSALILLSVVILLVVY